MGVSIVLVIVLVGAACGGLGYFLASKKRQVNSPIKPSTENTYSKFIDENQRPCAFDRLLDEAMTQSRSEYGLIGEVKYRSDGLPYLKVHAINDLQWDDNVRSQFQAQVNQSEDLVGVSSLIGSVLVAQNTVIRCRRDDPTGDECVVGRESLTDFIGIPLRHDGLVVGVLCLADAPDGYVAATELQLAALIKTVTQCIANVGNQVQPLPIDANACETSLTVARKELQRFFDLSPDFLCIIQSDGTFKKINHTFKHKLGYDEAQLIHCAAITFVHPDDIASMQSAMKQLAEGGVVSGHIARYRKSNDEYLSLRWRAMPDPLTGDIYATAEDVTESRRVYGEVKRLSRIAEEIPSVAVIADTNGKITWVNHAFESVTQYTLAEVIGRKPGDFLQGELTDTRTVDEMRTALAARKPFHVEIQNYRKDGEHYWVEIECQPLFNDEAEHEGFLAVQSEVTERIATQSALQTKQKILEQMSHLGNIGAWEYDLSDQKMYWSEVMRDIHGVESDFTPVLDDLLSFYPNEVDRESVKAQLQQTMSDGQSWRREVEIQRVDGERLWVTLSCSAEFDSSVCTKIYGAYQDIHERKLNQLAAVKLLAHSQALAKLTLDKHVLKGDFEQAAKEVVSVCAHAIGADRVSIWRFNELLDEMHLVVISDRGEFQENLELVIKREDFPQYFSHVFQHTFVNASLARTHPATSEFTDVYLKPLDIHSMLDAVISGGDHFAGVICIEQYEAPRMWSTAEESFACALATLMSSVYDRQSRKITERALKEAAEKANTAAQAKSDFLASMSHEIRTPMNGVLGMLGLILKTELSGDQERKVKIALNSAQSLLTIINDILDFSKIDAGKLSLEEMDFDLMSLFSEFSETMAFRAEEHNLELLINLRDVSISHVVGDPGRLRQVLTNLVGNALKFTHKGEILIHARTIEDAGDVILECSVTDTGIGIPKDKQADLFDQFTQVDTSNTRQYGGTGLGLSIVKRLCEAMGGRVWVDSEKGKGSCFTFTTRLRKNTAPELNLPVIDLAGKRVLVVDDNRTNQLIVAEQLAAWRCEAVVAESANAAMQACEQAANDGQMFDIALLDMQMPGTDGATLGKMLKEDQRFSPIPLVMMTSQAQRGDAEEFARLGFSGYFPKPVSPNILLEAIMVILDGQTLAYAHPLVTRHFLGNLDHSKLTEAKTEYRWKGKPRILLVEDNRINQEVALDLLTDLGLSADVAADGEEALHALAHAPAAHPYRLVLMDCQMPVLDGFLATEAIRRGEAGDINRDITIIALTANAMAGDKERCIEAGMNDYLSKPIDPDHLDSVLAQWLDVESSHEQKHDGDAAMAHSSATVSSAAEHNFPPKAFGALAGVASDVSSLENAAPKLNVVENERANIELGIWDKEAALKRVRGRHERLKQLIVRYTEQSPELISDIFQCVEIKDLQHAAELCHTLRGVAANLGALSLLENAQALEETCKAGDPEIAHRLAGELLVSNDHFVKAIRKFG